MFKLLFAIGWTGFTAIAAASAIAKSEQGLVRFAALLLPLIGIYFIYDSWRRLARRRSLRRDGDSYVWIEFDGTERRSPHDPTPDWDASDGGDGDGDGGDGGGD